MVGDRPGRVEQASGQQQRSRRGTGMDPHSRQREAGLPSPGR